MKLTSEFANNETDFSTGKYSSRILFSSPISLPHLMHFTKILTHFTKIKLLKKDVIVFTIIKWKFPLNVTTLSPDCKMRKITLNLWKNTLSWKLYKISGFIKIARSRRENGGPPHTLLVQNQTSALTGWNNSTWVQINLFLTIWVSVLRHPSALSVTRWTTQIPEMKISIEQSVKLLGWKFQLNNLLTFRVEIPENTKISIEPPGNF